MSIQPEPAVFGKAFPQVGACGNRHSENQSFENSPSELNHSEGNNMSTSLGFAPRNFQRRTGRTFKERFSTRDVTHALADVLSDFHAKEIAEASGSSVRAAENAKQGMNAMSLAHFLNACREIPELRAMAMQMMGCEVEANPERERALAMLVNSYVQRGG